MAWGGQTTGHWAGHWQGATTMAPGAIYGSAAITFTASGLLTQGGVPGELAGTAGMVFQGLAIPWLPADRFNWPAVLTGPAGYSNALLGRMALRTRRRR